PFQSLQIGLNEGNGKDGLPHAWQCLRRNSADFGKVFPSIRQNRGEYRHPIVTVIAGERVMALLQQKRQGA
ncbi:hypothetical protein, partial [Vibrio parahaemolyticus]|uniref:hypothetical protein n=1 Tax=Vibrio parahaemolyticus TaxID=670 RepID=UPI001A8D011A